MGGGGSRGISASEVKARQDAAYYKGQAEGLQKLNGELQKMLKEKDNAKTPE